MTYTQILSLVNDSYATFTSNYINRKRLGADDEYTNTQLFFVKCIYKVLLNQDGDETTDLLIKEEIQNCIKLFNKFSGSSVPLEYV
jgi:hypothetical protein